MYAFHMMCYTIGLYAILGYLDVAYVIFNFSFIEKKKPLPPSFTHLGAFLVSSVPSYLKGIICKLHAGLDLIITTQSK